jgi:hypothetical protein
MQAITVGLDIAKSVFQVHGVDADGQVVIHHAKVLARGLASQSREGCAEESATVRVRTT